MTDRAPAPHLAVVGAGPAAARGVRVTWLEAGPGAGGRV